MEQPKDAPESLWGKRVGALVSNLFAIYFFVAVMVAAPYFNWQYAQRNGFWSWLFLGQIVPTAKAMAWPYTLFVREHNASEETGEHFSRSLMYWQSAAKIMQDVAKAKTVTPTEAMTLVGLYDKALAEARLVDLADLNRHHAELGDKYRDLFIAGMQDMVESFQKKNEQQSQAGAVLLNSWADWFEPRASRIYRR